MLLLPVLLAVPASSAHASEPRSDKAAGGQPCSAQRAAVERDPQPATRLALCDCYAEAGLTTSAWSEARSAAMAAQADGTPELARRARARAKSLEPQLSYLTVSTWKSQKLFVTRNGVPIPNAELGSAIPVDPGPQVITASAPGKRGFRTRVEVGPKGDHIAVRVPVLPDDAAALRTREAEQPAEAAPSAPAAATSGGGASLQRSLALVSGAIGIAGVAAGTLFGLKAASDWQDAKAHCPNYPYCGAEGARLAREADQSAMISTLGFIAGVAGLSGGALLWFTAQDDAEEHGSPPSVAVGLGRVSVRGSL